MSHLVRDSVVPVAVIELQVEVLFPWRLVPRIIVNQQVGIGRRTDCQSIPLWVRMFHMSGIGVAPGGRCEHAGGGVGGEGTAALQGSKIEFVRSKCRNGRRMKKKQRPTL